MTSAEYDNNDGNSIKSLHVETAANTMLESPYGVHAVIIYSDITALKDFWSLYTKKSIEERTELVCLAPFYETVDSVRKILSEGHMSIDVKKYEKEVKSLIIMDALEKYRDKSVNAFDVDSLLKANHDLVEYADALKKNRVSILGEMGVFFFKNQIQRLIDYEFSLPTEFESSLKGVCLYHQKDFDRLSTDQKEKLINHHKIAIKI